MQEAREVRDDLIVLARPRVLPAKASTGHRLLQQSANPHLWRAQGMPSGMPPSASCRGRFSVADSFRPSSPSLSPCPPRIEATFNVNGTFRLSPCRPRQGRRECNVGARGQREKTGQPTPGTGMASPQAHGRLLQKAPSTQAVGSSGRRG
jgi:hypothetical protein